MSLRASPLRRGPNARRRVAQGAGVIGPALFIGGWVIGGLRTPGYSFTRDAISQLARTGAPHRVLMTRALIGFGISMTAFAGALSDGLGGRPLLRASVTLAGVGTLAVAAFPLSAGGGTPEDRRHGVCAAVAYVGTALSPVMAGEALWRAERFGPALACFGVGAISATALAATPFVSRVGLFQRLGLTVSDVFFAAAAVVLLREHPLGTPRPV